jgi:hypothetical protein
MKKPGHEPGFFMQEKLGTASMHLAGRSKDLMHAFDGADQDADVIAAEVRIALLDDTVSNAVHRAGGWFSLAAKQVVDMLPRFVVDGPQVRVFSALRLRASVLNFALVIHFALLV